MCWRVLPSDFLQFIGLSCRHEVIAHSRFYGLPHFSLYRQRAYYVMTARCNFILYTDNDMHTKFSTMISLLYGAALDWFPSRPLCSASLLGSPVRALCLTWFLHAYPLGELWLGYSVYVLVNLLHCSGVDISDGEELFLVSWILLALFMYQSRKVACIM